MQTKCKLLNISMLSLSIQGITRKMIEDKYQENVKK